MATKKKRKYKRKSKVEKEIETKEIEVSNEPETIESLVSNEPVIEGTIIEKKTEDTRELSSHEPTKELAKYQPKASQVRWLNKALELMTDSVSEIAKGCELDRANWYQWLDDPGFMDWYLGQWNEKIKIYSTQLDAVGIKRAAKDHKYWRDMQKIVGRLQDTPADSRTFLQMNVNFIDDMEQ
jgi:phage antirepressor YoqD-like protein